MDVPPSHFLIIHCQIYKSITGTQVVHVINVSWEWGSGDGAFLECVFCLHGDFRRPWARARAIRNL